MFCTCDTCARARRSGGKNIRTRSQALLDDTILIDFPADTYFHVITHGINLEKIKHLMDIDAAYDKLNRQEEMFSQLKQVKHLLNVDEVYDKLAMQEEFIHKQSQSLKTAYIISGVSTVLAIIGIIIGMVL